MTLTAVTPRPSPSIPPQGRRRRASQPDPRHEWRVAFGKKFGAAGKAIRQQIRAMEE